MTISTDCGTSRKGVAVFVTVSLSEVTNSASIFTVTLSSLVDLTKKYVAFYEEYLGPYPFRADKIGIAETPHLGMEHQTITAYGNHFKYNADGDDWLLFHEFGHEWWANLVTANDWRDFWIHEGFQSFYGYVLRRKNKR